MKRSFLLTVLLALWSAPSARPASLDLPVWRPASPLQAVPAYRADRLSLRLSPEAARAARSGAVRGSARALGVSAIDRALAALGATIRPEFRGETPPPAGSSAPDFTAFYLVDLPPDVELSSALDHFASLPEVAGASPVGVASVAAIPNDSLWAGSWHFYQQSRRDIHAPEGWDITQGDTSIVVAIIDTGVIPYHPDLGGVTPGSSGQIWTNAQEANGLEGVDDDGNGYVDDRHGWDFVALPLGGDYAVGEDWRDEDNDPNDFVGHGTSVAGLVGAITDNGIGVAGTAWKVRLLPLRVGWATVLNPTGVVDMSYIAQAIRYATLNGARVINISLSTTPLTELSLAVSAALESGVSVVVAAGNNGSTNGIPDFPGLINVSATDRNDVIPPWANVGAYVDFMAPGAAIPTTNLRRTGPDSLGMRQSGYVADANGTSFAAPIASGAVALIQSVRLQKGQPLLDPMLLKLSLMSGCDDISAANPGASSNYYGAGRLNLERTLTSESEVRLAKLPGVVNGHVIEFTRSNGRRALAASVSVRALSLPWRDLLLFLDAETLTPFREVDLNGRTLPELTAGDLGGGRGLGFFAADGYRIVGFGGGGAALPGWPVLASGIVTTPVLGDLDGDGELDIVSVVNDGYGFQSVYAWNCEGRLRQGFPVSLGQRTNLSPALADLDGAPGLEIVVQDADQHTWALRHDGRALPGWPASTPGVAQASPVVTRLDGEPLVLVFNRRNWYGLRANGQMALQRDFPADVGAMDPVLADLNQDGTEDLLVATSSSLDAWYLGPAAAPSAFWPQTPETAMTEPPLVGPLIADAGPEVLQPTTSLPLAFRSDGSRIRSPIRSPLGRLTWLSPTGGRSTICTPTSAGLVLFDIEGSESATWPVARGNFARTGCTVGAPPMSQADETPPVAITDLRSEATSASMVRLIWTTPMDPGGVGRVVAYDLRYSPGPISPGEFNLLPAVSVPRFVRVAGEAETLNVFIPAGDTRYFRIRAQDGSGNWGAVSNQTTGGEVSATPDPVTGLEVTGSSSREIQLRWTATGDDGPVGRPARYEIAASPLFLTPEEFDRTPFATTQVATVNAGATEATVMGGLPADTRFWIAVRAVDDEGNRSEITDRVQASTEAIGAHVDDVLPPAAVTDLRGGLVTSNTARLIWTAPTDDAALDRAVRYELRWSMAPLAEDTFAFGTVVPTPAWPRPGGAAETLWVQPPTSGRRFYALRSLDAALHVSALSNVFELIAPHFGLELASNPSRSPVRFLWNLGTETRGSLVLHDVTGRRVRDIPIETGSSGQVAWNGDDVDGRRMPAGLYFAVLSTPSRRTVTRLVLLP
ncbi:MAG TPA: S8 family serine peptidase [Candidatus Eisenbacteria bacterium]|nr:S8 family serine peptidase [Candidatus Eisenbacteria bacterium]